jgi:hypothetical protein
MQPMGKLVDPIVGLHNAVEAGRAWQRDAIGSGGHPVRS